MSSASARKPHLNLVVIGHIDHGKSTTLEAAGLVTKVERRGRVLTPKGRALLEKLATNILKQMAAERPELAKYL